jgi:exosortase
MRTTAKTMNADIRIEETTPKGPGQSAEGRALLGALLANISRVEVVALIAVAATLTWAYAPNFLAFYQVWVREPDYTHGFLVVPIALFIFWRRWPSLEEDRPTPWSPGWALVVASLAARAWFNERGQSWLESATLLPVVVGLALARLGPRTMLKVWPAFAFLIFLYPLPPQINTALSQPLQSLATWCACALLRLTGLWVMPEGNVILVGNERLEVAAACNGLSMLMSLAATVAATASLVPMANWKRILLLPSIIPIALGSNVLRIAATAWCYYKFGSDVGSKYAHDAAGWLMMPTAMVLVGLELAIMSWLIVESEEDEMTGDRLGLGRMGGPPKPNQGGRS